MRPKKTILCVDDNEQALAVRNFFWKPAAAIALWQL